MGSNSTSSSFLNDELSKRTSIFGLRLWVVIGIGVGVFIVLILFCLSIWLASKKKSKRLNEKGNAVIPMVSKEIQEVRILDPLGSSNGTHRDDLSDRDPEKGYAKSASDIEGSDVNVHVHHHHSKQSSDRQGVLRDRHGGSLLSDKLSNASGETPRSIESPASSVPEVSHLGWGHWYILRDLEVATNGFSPDNMIGEGGYGIVYRGVMPNGHMVAVKNLLNNRGQAEKEFKVEVEAIGRVRHKNLVRLLG